MRNLGTLILVMAVAACEGGPREIKEPPVLTVTSPARGTLQDGTGALRVSGTVLPNASGDPIDRVLVNDVEATVKDGAFSALIEVRAGATLIHTEARDAAGGVATDTRAIHAGPLRAVGTTVPAALTAAISAPAFTKISEVAGPMIEGLDVGALLAPRQPMVAFGDPEDCLFALYAQLFVDDVELSNAEVTLAPVAGGLAFRAELDGLRVAGRARYGATCLDLSNDLGVSADKVVVAGILDVAPDGTSGFTTNLRDPQVEVTGPDLQVSGIPGQIVDVLRLDSVLGLIAPVVAELAMDPLVNQALGALAGPQQLDLLGTTLTIEVAPTELGFLPSGASVTMDMKVLLAGGETSRGYIFTDNTTPAMDAGEGFHLGIADDLANQVLAEAHAAGLLNLAVPTPGGAFDTAQIQMALPPMINASSGAMHLVLGDMLTTFLKDGQPVARASINARVDVRVAPSASGASVGLELGTPELHVDVLDDVPNVTGLSTDRLASAATGGLKHEIDSISQLLRVIPIPAIAGLQMRDVSVGGADGYVMVRGRFE